MRRSVLSFGLSSLAIVTLAGCTGDDTNPAVPDSGSPSDASSDGTTGHADAAPDGSVEPTDSAAGDGGQDGGPGADASDASVGPFLLLSYYYDGYTSTGYSAFDVPSATQQGSLSYPSNGGGGINVSTALAPWVLEQGNDLVLRMDPAAPWKAMSSWSLATVPPAPDSMGNVDPFAVAEVGSKAYVLSYASDSIAVLDTSQAYDAGAPTELIPLVPDGGANLQGMALAYDASQSKIWVVLGNANSPAYPPLCAPEYHPTVVAIDTTSDTLVSNLTYTLQGYGLAFGTQAVVFDSANDRLLIASEGCNDPADAGDGGVTDGPLDEAYIEQVPLSGSDAGSASILLHLSPANSPTAFIWGDSTHAYLQMATGTTYAWDSTQGDTLGAAIPNAPDTFVWDGHGLLGPKSMPVGEDGGVSFAVISVDPADGGVTTIATDPFTPAPADPFAQEAWQSIDLWPHP